MSHDACGTDDRPSTGPTDGDDGVSRRGLMVTGAATMTTMSVAGCSDNGESTPEETETLTVTSDTSTTDSTAGSPADDDTPTPTDTQTPSPTGTSCTEAGLFLQGQEIGFLVGVYDRMTGELLGPDAIDSVTLSFPDAGLAARQLSWRGDHDAVAADRWGVALSETDRLEPGRHNYEVAVSTVDGREATVTDVFKLTTL